MHRRLFIFFPTNSYSFLPLSFLKRKKKNLNEQKISLLLVRDMNRREKLFMDYVLYKCS